MSEAPIPAMCGFTLNPDGSITLSILVDGRIGETRIPTAEVLRLRDLLNKIEEE